VNQAWPSETLALIGAQALIVQGLITRVMANGTVDALLQKVGLGSAPRCATSDGTITEEQKAPHTWPFKGWRAGLLLCWC